MMDWIVLGWGVGEGVLMVMWIGVRCKGLGRGFGYSQGVRFSGRRCCKGGQHVSFSCLSLRSYLCIHPSNCIWMFCLITSMLSVHVVLVPFNFPRI
jgi:hypothetical protein